MSTNSTELAALVKPDEDKAIAALYQNDLRLLDELLARMADGHAGLHALSIHTIARKIAKFKADYGEEKAREILNRISTELMSTWIEQYRTGHILEAISDLVSVFKHQYGARIESMEESHDFVTLTLSPCGSGGFLEKQGFPRKYGNWYGEWADGVSAFCQGCKANQRALNQALGEDAWITEKRKDGECIVRFSKRNAGNRLFSDDDVKTLCTTRVERAREAIARGDLAVESLLSGQRKEWMPWHDFGIVWLEYMYASALELGGPDYLDELLRETYESGFVAGFKRYANMSDLELVADVARTWNYHMADFTVSETESAYVFTLDPCGSGGRLYRGSVWRDMFRYGKPLAPLMPDAHPINFRRKGAPTYCTHCAASNRAQLEGGLDAPLFFLVDGHAQVLPGDACRQFTLKKGKRDVSYFQAQISK